VVRFLRLLLEHFMDSPTPSTPPTSKPPRRKGRALHRNGVSYVGGFLVVVGLVLLAMSVVMQFSIKHPGPYFGIFTFLLFPGVILVGLALYGLGMRLESGRRRRTGNPEARPYPALDLNDPRQRLRFQVGLVSSSVLFIVLAFSGYNGLLLTSSVGFCGNTCHTQMEPEMTAYGSSPHARVSCVDCHVGGGASHYMQAKMNGVKQVTEVMLGTYARPIPTPTNLRPARETCEACHWPSKTWGSTVYQRPHFRYDEASTAEQITMLMRVGGGKGAYGDGIHWHMAAENVVTYVTNDAHGQDIPWVRIVRGDGSAVEYWRSEKPLDPAKLGALTKQTMDCIDCHNRPAHTFETPDVAVDKALAAGVFSKTLPWAKSLAVETLSTAYASRAAAHEGIPKAVRAFYQQKYPEVVAMRGADMDKLGAGLLELYDRNVFPEMRVDWTTYPSNLGHRNSAGCFRCHDGKHVAADGKVLVSECKVCHSMPQRGPPTAQGDPMPDSNEDWHPWQMTAMTAKHVKVDHRTIQCHECHEGGRKPKTECNDCHAQ
jgi:nitrate/TMAO reductase-like tetraheme cytochrome c subunit